MKTVLKLVLICSLVPAICVASGKVKVFGQKVVQSGSVHVPGKAILTIDDSASDWKTMKDDPSNIQLSAENGPSKAKALSISYDLGAQGQWVQAYMEGSFDLSGAKALAFAYKGDGNKNSIEVKVELADGATFGKLLESATAEKNWVVASIPISDFQYFWGGQSKSLDLQNVKKIYFAVSKKSNDKGKSGKVLISEVSKVQ